MKGLFLGMTLLALGAGGVVWIAVNEHARTRPSVKTASVASVPTVASVATVIRATPPPMPTPMPMPVIEIVDAAAPTTDATFPPLDTYAAWSVVRWGMSAPEVLAALRRGGIVVETTDAKRVRAKRDGWDVTIDVGASGASEIVVTAAGVSKEEAEAAVAAIAQRAPATSTLEHAERHWKKEGGASSSFVIDVDGTTATMREEHIRERSPGGGLGFASLHWGMSTQEVVGQLTARGYAASAVKGSLTLPFSKGDVEGTASFNQFGLRQIEISGPTSDRGATRARELESSLGKPASVEVSKKTKHVDHGRMTSIDVEVTDKQPGGGITVVETYRPKH